MIQEIIEKLRDLPEKIRRTPMPIKDLIPVILSTADALEQLHSENVTLCQANTLLDLENGRKEDVILKLTHELEVATLEGKMYRWLRHGLTTETVSARDKLAEAFKDFDDKPPTEAEFDVCIKAAMAKDEEVS